jgi:hypothetical protein
MYFQMKFRLYGYILDILKIQLSCAILQTVYSCKYSMCLYFVNTAVLCQLYSSTKLILICFQDIIFEKEVSAP